MCALWCQLLLHTDVPMCRPAREHAEGDGRSRLLLLHICMYMLRATGTLAVDASLEGAPRGVPDSVKKLVGGCFGHGMLSASVR
jgi:hypothetical protein